MAYISQEMKKTKAPRIKAILKKYGLKGTLSIHHHSSLCLNISEGSLDFLKLHNELAKKDCEWNGMSFHEERTYLQVNTHHCVEWYKGTCIGNFFKEVLSVMNEGNHDNSDIMTDYFDVGFYVHINIGKWNKPYIFKGE